MNLHRFLTLIFVFFLSWNLLPATTFMVTSNGDIGPGSLRQAVIDANNDGSASLMSPHIIQFNLSAPPPCVISINNRIEIENFVDIQGTGIDVLFIEMAGSDRLFEVRNGAVAIMSDLTIRDGNINASGGALTVEGGSELTINRVRFSNNQGEAGGAIRVGDDDKLTAIDCIFELNTGENGGAIAVGGGSGNTNMVSLNRCIFRGNEATNRGGAIFLDRGPFEMFNSVLSGNKADRGGAVFGDDNVMENRIINCSISGNEARRGGGVNNDSGTDRVILGNTVIALNTATEAGPDILLNNPTQSLGGNFIGVNDGGAGDFPSGAPNVNNDHVGTGSSPIDPDFVMNVSGPAPSLDGDLRPTPPNSPLINNGVNALASTLTNDLQGNPRIESLSVDTGAYEVLAINIPTLSEWGILVLTLILLITGILQYNTYTKNEVIG